MQFHKDINSTGYSYFENHFKARMQSRRASFKIVPLFRLNTFNKSKNRSKVRHQISY